MGGRERELNPKNNHITSRSLPSSLHLSLLFLSPSICFLSLSVSLSLISTVILSLYTKAHPSFSLLPFLSFSPSFPPSALFAPTVCTVSSVVDLLKHKPVRFAEVEKACLADTLYYTLYSTLLYIISCCTYNVRTTEKLYSDRYI